MPRAQHAKPTGCVRAVFTIRDDVPNDLRHGVFQQAGKTFQYYIYPKADHAFFNDTGNRHNPEASKLAWQRTLEFLKS